MVELEWKNELLMLCLSELLILKGQSTFLGLFPCTGAMCGHLFQLYIAEPQEGSYRVPKLKFKLCLGY